MGSVQNQKCCDCEQARETCRFNAMPLVCVSFCTSKAQDCALFRPPPDGYIGTLTGFSRELTGLRALLQKKMPARMLDAAGWHGILREWKVASALHAASSCQHRPPLLDCAMDECSATIDGTFCFFSTRRCGRAQQVPLVTLSRPKNGEKIPVCCNPTYNRFKVFLRFRHRPTGLSQ